MKTDEICESCKTKSIVFVAKPQSKAEIKSGVVIGFHICSKCDPVMASFHLLDNGYEELRREIVKINSKK